MAQKKKQQQSARERVRAEQQARAAQDQRVKVVFRSLIGVAVLAVVAVVAAIALNQGGGASATPGNMTDDGVVLVGQDGGVDAEGSADAAEDLPRVGVYVDFQCPHCLAFEQTNMPFLTEQVEAGAIALEVHPVALMDNASQGTQFSSRAANAAACVATHEPGAFLDVTQSLFDLQQAATQGSVNDDVLTGAVSDAGAGSADTRACILDREYDGWVRDATDRALADPDLAGPSGRFGTPTVLIDGERFAGEQTPEGLAAALGL
ncbi:DsbA family protein [Ornithinimicrobium sp. F0845]|uniref:DsbA family protein n=1 Tax=Ornithinimicrobium sp. F0845 TaxID=2926412 RepID=UPI001FF572A9|nr:thioredoxin domain-containing protein [Ornithinimicrobium sp. F0845]MCK0112630.1 DsbA family protein [Ornithinimicrobium sp. F0845]